MRRAQLLRAAAIINTSVQAVSLVFDLDGTLSDPVMGIGRSLNYALEALGYTRLDEGDVSRFVGPPLDVAFREIVPGAPQETVVALVDQFRERYAEVGYAENALYPGIPEALERLWSERVSMGVCTLKRSDFAERILDLFEIRRYFAFVQGGDIGVTKRDQLGQLLADGMLTPASTMIRGSGGRHPGGARPWTPRRGSPVGPRYPVGASVGRAGRGSRRSG